LTSRENANNVNFALSQPFGWAITHLTHVTVSVIPQNICKNFVPSRLSAEKNYTLTLTSFRYTLTKKRANPWTLV